MSGFTLTCNPASANAHSPLDNQSAGNEHVQVVDGESRSCGAIWLDDTKCDVPKVRQFIGYVALFGWEF